VTKAHKDFERIVRQRGVTLEQGGKHYKIVHNGRQVGVLAKTGETNALRQAMRDLRRQGIVGDAECKVRF
jgi:hypothetical protein